MKRACRQRIKMMNLRFCSRLFFVTLINLLALSACKTVDIKEANFFTPRQVMTEGERLEVRAQDGVLLVGRLLREDKPRGTIIFFTGNADLTILSGRRIRKYADFGFNVVAVDYRGSGESGGTLTLANLQSDALAIYQAVAARDDLRSKRILAYGWSLGSFAATYLALHAPVDGLVLEGAETNVTQVLSAWTPWYAKPFVRFNIDPSLTAADNLVALKEYKGPLLLISGQQDKIAPPVFSEHLYNATASSNKNWVRTNAEHNGIFDASEFSPALESFSSLVFGVRQH